MVTVSGNLATNLVLESVGLAEVAAVLSEAGCSERTQVVRGIEDYAARDAGTDNLVTADDLARLMVALAEGRLAGPAATAACERTLLAQTYRDGIPAGLPAGRGRRQQDRLDRRGEPRRRAGAGGGAAAGRDRRPGHRAGLPAEREAGIARVTRAAWAAAVSDRAGPTMTR